jgi:hypothetical protein
VVLRYCILIGGEARANLLAWLSTNYKMGVLYKSTYEYKRKCDIANIIL